MQIMKTSQASLGQKKKCFCHMQEPIHNYRKYNHRAHKTSPPCDCWDGCCTLTCPWLLWSNQDWLKTTQKLIQKTLGHHVQGSTVWRHLCKGFYQHPGLNSEANAVCFILALNSIFEILVSKSMPFSIVGHFIYLFCWGTANLFVQIE